MVGNYVTGKRPIRLMVRTPGFHPGNRGSIPLSATNYGAVAQLVEQGSCKAQVVGSNPISGSMIKV